jgi:hypothetical protein
MGVHISTARALLLQSKLPTFLWAEAVNFIVWLHNHQSTTSVPTLKTPHKIITRKCLNFATLHPWGYRVLVKDLNAGKLQSRVREGRYLGPDSESLGYRIYWEGKQSITVEREVFFDVPGAESVSVEGETTTINEDDDFVYLSDSNTSSTSYPHPTLHFPQEDDDGPDEFPDDSLPTSPTFPVFQEPIYNNNDKIPELMEYSDDEDDGEDDEEDEKEDDDEVERKLLREEGGE